MNRLFLGTLLAASFVHGVVELRTASACGGCFAPQGQPSTVTAHRMAVALSAEQTTLWDQFEYAGAPEDFVWVLPISGGQDVSIELSDDAFFESLQAATQVTLTAPTPPFSGGGGSGFGCGDSDFRAAAPASNEMSAVTVFRSETVGPYETVVIGSEDPNALVDWLQTNGYAVPNELLPTIDHYVGDGLNFAVLRLSPGQGVQHIQPVRVSSPGLNMTFPLRMVAAGIGAAVSLELFVLAEGRYEAENFPNEIIDRDALTYDWDSNLFNYDQLADVALGANDGRTWLTEFAAPVNRGFVDVSYEDDAGMLHTSVPDWNHVFDTVGRQPEVTRMRAELRAEHLGEDLILAASLGPDITGNIQVTNELNRPGAVFGPNLSGRGNPWNYAYPLVFLVAGAFLLRRRATRTIRS
ncbi:MAG: DUF2330 domain-containing protein [Myxococcota bacterium]